MPTAIVTGASSGLGLAIASALAARGYAIVANSRSISADHPSVGEIGAKEIAPVAGDVGDRAVAARVFGTAIERFGGVDLLVNNAGIFIPKPFTDYTEEEFMRLMRTNVLGFFHLTQLALGHMAERGAGHVITITTSLADNPLKAVPSAVPILAKAGLNGATRALALEYADRGVRVNAIAPGIIKTPMHAPETHDFLATLHPVGRMGEAEDIAQGVLFLERAPFVTGEILHIDGGAWSGRW
ncbi:MAG: SDR family NAD(P)-dependent oxidoreductase [Phycisphaerales bacterium]